MKKFLITILIMLFLPVFGFAKETPKNHVDIAFTIDNNYPLITMILIDSILANSKADFTFWVVENNITDKNKAKMKKFVEQDKHQKIEFVHIDKNIIDDGDDLFAFSNYITPIGLARIFLPDLLPKSVHKVLYLDSDMLATGDVAEIYNTPLGNNIAGMVINILKDYNDQELYEFKKGYYNSGLILMNLDMCRKENSSRQMINYLKKNKKDFIFDEDNWDSKTWLYPDQDLINLVWEGRIKTIPKNWNNQSIRGYSIEKDLSVPGIIHYIGPSKPWDYDGLLHFKYVKIYFDYWKKSPFSAYRYYYFAQKYIKDYKKLLNKKIRRYELFFERVKNKSKLDSIMLLFYTYDKIKR